MGSVRSVSTDNFNFALEGSEKPGMVAANIKPITPAGKALFRFKQFGKMARIEFAESDIFKVACDYEGKVSALAAI